MALRIERHSRNAQAVVDHLAGRRFIEALSLFDHVADLDQDPASFGRFAKAA
ncbi:hypothetical protein AIGOOFII_0830 [Methylobacterium marchantiae]|nr:hypothetical protein AIGOOFII_0830 [Methylobacterium marchantiae]